MNLKNSGAKMESQPSQKDDTQSMLSASSVGSQASKYGHYLFHCDHKACNGKRLFEHVIKGKS